MIRLQAISGQRRDLLHAAALALLLGSQVCSGEEPAASNPFDGDGEIACSRADGIVILNESESRGKE